MMEIIGTIATLLAITGVLLNNRRRRECFYLWIVSNACTLAIHVTMGLVSLAIRDVAFFVLAIEGLVRWGRRPNLEAGK